MEKMIQFCQCLLFVLTLKTSLIGGAPVTVDICKGNFDSIASIRGKIYVFKDQIIWTMYNMGGRAINVNKTLQEVFELPTAKFYEKVDAVYSNSNESRIILFFGSKYRVYEFNNQWLPKFITKGPITDFGLNSSVKKIDAAFYSKENNKTYLYRKSTCWEYDEKDKTIKKYDTKLELPKNDSIQGALNWNKKNYFFHGNTYWTTQNATYLGKPRFNMISDYWKDCK